MSEHDEQNVTRKSGLVYAAVFAIVSSILVCLVGGWLLDKWLGTSPWLVVGGLLLGTVVGFYEFVVIMSRVD